MLKKKLLLIPYGMTRQLVAVAFYISVNHASTKKYNSEFFTGTFEHPY